MGVFTLHAVHSYVSNGLACTVFICAPWLESQNSCAWKFAHNGALFICTSTCCGALHKCLCKQEHKRRRHKGRAWRNCHFPVSPALFTTIPSCLSSHQDLPQEFHAYLHHYKEATRGRGVLYSLVLAGDDCRAQKLLY